MHIGTGLDPRDRVSMIRGMVEQYDRDGLAEGFVIAFIALATVEHRGQPKPVKVLHVACLQRDGKARGLVETFITDPLVGRRASPLPYGPADVRREYGSVFGI